MKPLSYHEYVKTCIKNRKKKLDKMLVASHMDDMGITSARERGKEAERYRKTEDYQKKITLVYEKDLTLKRLQEEPEHPSIGMNYKSYLKVIKEKERIEQEVRKNRETASFLLEEYVEEKRDEIAAFVAEASEPSIRQHLLEGVITHMFSDSGTNYRKRGNSEPLTIDNFDEYIEETEDKIISDLENYLTEEIGCEGVYELGIKWYEGHPSEKSDEIRILLSGNQDAETDLFIESLIDHDIAWHTGELLDEIFSEEVIRDLLLRNPYLKKIKKEAEERVRIDKLMEQDILKRMPENIKDIYPAARHMNRHFIIHAGPTNSGKTYEALERFRTASSGAYLAPLRLLAYEAYEDTNRKGVLCELKTGEEEIVMPGAVHVAQTIETLDLHKYYDTVVIDEAQMVEDSQRGGAWSTAIMGVRAEEIHLCTASHAVPVLKKLIEYCGDTWEKHVSERKTPLIFEEEEYLFPESIEEGDALIVFSKASVLNCAAELQQIGIPCSIIYGTLPYEVRRSEAARFLSGETKVVVSTDAIGMGMNLPIRRIIFLETSKFDGIRRRNLSASEIKQIAGRAGRWGIQEKGYVNAVKDRKLIRAGIEQDIRPVEKIRIQFPSQLIAIEGSVSAIMEKWKSMPSEEFFTKENLEESMELCRILENETTNKELIYQMSTIPFNQKNADVRALWKTLFMDIDKNGSVSLQPYLEIMRARPEYEAEQNKELNDLETRFQRCDLMYYVINYYGDTETKEKDKAELLSMKKGIARKITELLKKENLSKRRCEKCRKILPWNHTYRICDRCYRMATWW